MKTWIISDTHLNHQKMETYCDRPTNHTELTDRNIHQMVQPTDILIHLGDIGMGKENVWADTVRKWPGLKWLVRGNHDGKGCQWYVEQGLFHMACDGLIYRGVWLTHKPWLTELPKGTNLNVHGHLHNVWDGFYPEDPKKEQEEFVIAARSGRLLSPLHRLLAIEYTGYMPVEFDKFVSRGHKLWQSTGPNEETKKRVALKYADSLKCSSCIDSLPTAEIGGGYVRPESTREL